MHINTHAYSKAKNSHSYLTLNVPKLNFLFPSPSTISLASRNGFFNPHHSSSINHPSPPTTWYALEAYTMKHNTMIFT